MTTTYSVYYESPVGHLEIKANDQTVTEIAFVKKTAPRRQGGVASAVLKETVRQLDEYFAGERRAFDLPVSFDGTEFQTRVWESLQNIPHGETVSYRDLAEMVGNPKASRAVGNANKRNRLAIIVPCHRVVQADGTLGGYAGGVSRKEWLLKHEKGEEV